MIPGQQAKQIAFDALPLVGRTAGPRGFLRTAAKKFPGTFRGTRLCQLIGFPERGPADGRIVRQIQLELGPERPSPHSWKNP